MRDRCSPGRLCFHGTGWPFQAKCVRIDESAATIDGKMQQGVNVPKANPFDELASAKIQIDLRVDFLLGSWLHS